MLSVPNPLQAQHVHESSLVWLETDFSKQIAPNWRLQTDFILLRQSAWDASLPTRFPMRYGFRAWGHYQLDSAWIISGFGGYWLSYALNEGERVSETRDLRFGGQVIYQYLSGRSQWQYRLRPEFRHMYRRGVEDDVLRLRCQVRIRKPFRSKSGLPSKMSFQVSNELFFQTGSSITGYHSIDQDRMMLGVNRRMSAVTSLDLNTGLQWSQHPFDSGSDWMLMLQGLLTFQW